MPLLRIALLALLVLATVAGGCGGDDDDGGDATPATTATAGGGGGDEGGAILNGSVGPGFDISLAGADSLSAGDYTLVVNDQSREHNFHLTGPGGVDVSTDVDAVGEETFEVMLEPGEYTYVCDPHASDLRGSFTVG